jgi:two-component system LytT family response regulator
MEEAGHMAIKVMLVDDEPQIRKILRKVIERNKQFIVVCECDNMTDALLQFHMQEPEIVFMDIEINGSSGIDCAKVILEMKPDTKIIFATAHSEYMSNAFEMYAFDYLVKPFNIERIEHTLERIEKQLQSNKNVGKEGHNSAGLVSVASASADAVTATAGLDNNKNKLLIKGKENVNLIDTHEIVFVERENNRTAIYMADGECHSTSASLSEIEARLDQHIFMRSHKSYIVNVTRIKTIEPYGRWTYTAKFSGIKKDALITKENYEQIRQMYT